ncbi:MAG: carboxypeptidase regulatory-like domain-containing protein [Pseudomonadota bacterium]
MKRSPTTRKTLSTAILIALGTVALPLQAQDTTSAIRGSLTGADGQPLGNATITVEDVRTGATRTLRSNASGSFYATNLPVGGPYRVTVNDDESVTIDSISLGDTYNLNLNLDDTSPVEEIVVVGSSSALEDLAPGPNASFSTFDMNTSVAFDRDIKDIYSIDPRMNLDGSQVNCVGKHPRFNSITLDGVSQDDRFGLNSNGYSTATGMPFPFEAISQVSVELAPFDVTYGGFTACNINAVTKSGNNTWTGTAFFETTGDAWRGDSLEVDGVRQQFESEDYTEEKYGFSLGGPLIRDRLFLFGAYEETEEPRFLAMSHAGSGNGVERPWLSQSQFQQIEQIAADVYGYETGGMPGNGVQTEEKLMLRMDWNINAMHDAALIYNHYDGIQDRSSDGDSNEFEFANHFYRKGAETETVTARLSSQWSDSLSTEVFFSTNTMDDSQVTVGPQEFADMQISIGSNTVYLGADDSRQANALNTESTFLKLNAEYLAGDHLLTAGYERENLEIFNQFVQHARGGEYDFFDDSQGNPARCADLGAEGRLADPDCGLSGIDRFQLGRPSRIYYGSGGGTNDPADAAANFENTLNTVYLQDEWYLAQWNLTLTGGLRYDWFESDDRPNFNANFTEANGIRNDANIDGLDLLMPRLGFTWEVEDNLTLRGGLGLYSGGNPNVWISNAWSNDGLTNVQLQLRNFDSSRSVIGDLPLSGEGRPGYNVPQQMVDEVASTTADSASNSRLVLIDPDYEQPSEWKFSLGGTYTFDNGPTVDADLLHSRQNNAPYYVDLSQSIVGTTRAGQPIYDYTNGQDNFMLTNASDNGQATSLSLTLDDRYDNGLDWMVGYALTEAEDVSPMTSSVAGSNFDNLALFDQVDPRAGTSNYVTPHRFTARVSYGREFIAGHETRVTAMFYRSEGQPQSHVMSSSDLEGDGFFGRHLLYVPGVNDDNVVLGPDFDQQAFNDFVSRNGYGQGFVERNAVHAKWSSRLDLRLDQELPTFLGNSNGRVYMKVYNLMNMIDDSWGLQYDAQFFSQQVVDMSLNDQGQYVFERFNDRGVTDLQENRSLWEVRVGVQFEF